jgi:hypothetical protein
MCGSEACDLTLELEIDKELRMINMNFYKDLYYCSYWGDPKDRSTLKLLYGRIFKKEPPDLLIELLSDLWLRIKGAVRLLLTGRIKVSESFIFGNDKQIDSFIKALDEGKAALTKLRTKRGESQPAA